MSVKIIIKMKMILMKIINYAKKYLKGLLKPRFIGICLFSAFVFPFIKSDILKFFAKWLFKLKGHNTDYDLIFNGLPIIVGLILCNLIITMFTDIYRSVKESFKQEKSTEKSTEESNRKRLNYMGTKEVFTFHIHDLEVWARKNNLYDKVPETLWEELRVAKKACTFRYTIYEDIPLRPLLKRYRKINYFMNINTKIFMLLRNNKSNNILLKCYYKIKSFIAIKFRKYK